MKASLNSARNITQYRVYTDDERKKLKLRSPGSMGHVPVSIDELRALLPTFDIAEATIGEGGVAPWMTDREPDPATYWHASTADHQSYHWTSNEIDELKAAAVAERERVALGKQTRKAAPSTAVRKGL